MTTATTSASALRAKIETYRAAFGTTDHPHFALASAALASEDEATIAASLAFIERSEPSETQGLAAVASELDADKSAPTLWLAIDVERLPGTTAGAPTAGDYRTHIARDGAMRVAHGFRRENATVMRSKAPLGARILFPATGVDFRLVEVLAQVAQGSAPHLFAQSRDARAALLAAAVARIGGK